MDRVAAHRVIASALAELGFTTTEASYEGECMRVRFAFPDSGNVVGSILVQPNHLHGPDDNTEEVLKALALEAARAAARDPGIVKAEAPK